MRPVIVGNWKMNGSSASMAELDQIDLATRAVTGVDVLLCPPHTLLAQAARRVSVIRIGGQDCHIDASGSHTGSVSAAMVRDTGASAVILGHSERRSAFGESDDAVRRKVSAALESDLLAIVCVGESEADKSAGNGLRVVEHQIETSIPDAVGADRVIIAYEPLWAIGTGRTARPEDVTRMHSLIREAATSKYRRGEDPSILYGGSVEASSAAALLNSPEVDGLLVGGASLRASTFIPIVQTAAIIAGTKRYGDRAIDR